MNKEKVKGGLNKVFCGYIILLIATLFTGSGDYASLTDIPVTDWVGACASIVALVLVLIGIKAAAEGSSAYAKAQRYVVALIVWQVVGAILASIPSFPHSASADSIVETVLGFMAIKALLDGNAEVNTLGGHTDLADKAKKLWKKYLCASIAFIIASICLIILGVATVFSAVSESSEVLIGGLGLGAVVALLAIIVIGIWYLVVYIQILLNIKKTASAI